MMKNKFALVALLAILVYGWNYWGTSIYILDEAKNAGCAAEMMQRGDLIIPMFNNEFHDKPAVQYYFMMAAYRVFGVNAFSARFFSVVFGVLTVLSVFWFARRILNEKVAFYASLLLISSFRWPISSGWRCQILITFLSHDRAFFILRRVYRKPARVLIHVLCIHWTGIRSEGPYRVCLARADRFTFPHLEKGLFLEPADGPSTYSRSAVDVDRGTALVHCRGTRYPLGVAGIFFYYAQFEPLRDHL